MAVTEAEIIAPTPASNVPIAPSRYGLSLNGFSTSLQEIVAKRIETATRATFSNLSGSLTKRRAFYPARPSQLDYVFELPPTQMNDQTSHRNDARSA
jgi:hypothetical protein